MKDLRKGNIFNNTRVEYYSRNSLIKKSISNYAAKSKAGSNFNNEPKQNQDSYNIIQNYCNIEDQWFSCVCDGHGIYGHLVSDFIKTNLSIYVGNIYQNFIQEIPGNKEENKVKFKFVKGDNCEDGILSLSSLKANALLKKAFYQIDFDLEAKTKINIDLSGSTCVSVILNKKKLICANVGDSRAILASRIIDNENRIHWEITELSHDHKPTLKEEAQRILSAKGILEPLYGLNKIDEEGHPLGPLRVWAKGKDYPGLSMSRSFGDRIGRKCGVVCEPGMLIRNN